MNQVKDYLAIKAISTDELTSYVNLHIKMGYTPFGGICCSTLNVDKDGKPTNVAVFCQAMVKYN